MNYCVAASLIFGWYLMLPPIVSEKGKIGVDHQHVLEIGDMGSPVRL